MLQGKCPPPFIARDLAAAVEHEQPEGRQFALTTFHPRVVRYGKAYVSKARLDYAPFF